MEQQPGYEDRIEITRESSEDLVSGERIAASGKTGCLLLAGGQGSRFGAGIPKGKVSVSPVRGKTLFQMFFEKIFWAGKRYGITIPVAVMTSSENDLETRRFLQERRYFGVDPSSVFYFIQEDLPFRDEEGHLLPLQGPDGNGKAFHRLYASGIAAAFKERGVEYVSVVPIDNPLADPLDLGRLGAHERTRADLSVIAVKRKSDREKAGVLILQEGKYRVIEYTDLSEIRGYSWINTGLFLVSLNRIETIGKENLPLPEHRVRKRTPSGLSIVKTEYFLFDTFPYFEKIIVVGRERNECFAPLKNAVGEDDLSTVRAALIEKDRRRYSVLTGKAPPEGVFELSSGYYYLGKGQERAIREKSLVFDRYLEPEGL